MINTIYMFFIPWRHGMYIACHRVNLERTVHIGTPSVQIPRITTSYVQHLRPSLRLHDLRQCLHVRHRLGRGLEASAENIQAIIAIDAVRHEEPFRRRRRRWLRNQL